MVAASAIAGGKALSVMFQTTSALTSTVEDMAFASWVPVSATLVIKEIIVKKVSIILIPRKEMKRYISNTVYYWQRDFLSLRFFSFVKMST